MKTNKCDACSQSLGKNAHTRSQPMPSDSPVPEGYIFVRNGDKFVTRHWFVLPILLYERYCLELSPQQKDSSRIWCCSLYRLCKSHCSGAFRVHPEVIDYRISKPNPASRSASIALPPHTTLSSSSLLLQLRLAKGSSGSRMSRNWQSLVGLSCGRSLVFRERRLREC